MRMIHSVSSLFFNFYFSEKSNLYHQYRRGLYADTPKHPAKSVLWNYHRSAHHQNRCIQICSTISFSFFFLSTINKTQNNFSTLRRGYSEAKILCFIIDGSDEECLNEDEVEIGVDDSFETISNTQSVMSEKVEQSLYRKHFEYCLFEVSFDWFSDWEKFGKLGKNPMQSIGQTEYACKRGN